MKPFEAQQVEGCRSQARHHASAITPVKMGILMQLCVSDPVPALNAPAVAHLS